MSALLHILINKFGDPFDKSVGQSLSYRQGPPASGLDYCCTPTLEGGLLILLNQRTVQQGLGCAFVSGEN